LQKCISPEGIIDGSHPDIDQVLEAFAFYCLETRTASQTTQLWHGAVTPSLQCGSVTKQLLAQGHHLIGKMRKSHVPGEKTTVGQRNFSRYMVEVSNRIFGPPSNRIATKNLNWGDIVNWLLTMAMVEHKVRPSELLAETQRPSDPFDQLIIPRDIAFNRLSGTFTLRRPKKQLRQKGYYKPVRVADFNRDFDRDEHIISLAHTLHLVQVKAKSEKIDLLQPLWAGSPVLNRKSIITTRTHREWQVSYASAVGFPLDAARLFTHRVTRRAAMTATVNSAPNPIVAATLAMHAGPDMTTGYHNLTGSERAEYNSNNLVSLANIQSQPRAHRLTIIYLELPQSPPQFLAYPAAPCTTSHGPQVQRRHQANKVRSALTRADAKSLRNQHEEYLLYATRTKLYPLLRHYWGGNSRSRDQGATPQTPEDQLQC